MLFGFGSYLLDRSYAPYGTMGSSRRRAGVAAGFRTRLRLAGAGLRVGPRGTARGRVRAAAVMTRRASATPGAQGFCASAQR